MRAANCTPQRNDTRLAGASPIAGSLRMVACTGTSSAAVRAQILRAVLTRKTQQPSMLLKAHIEASKLEVRKISLHRLDMAQRENARSR